MANTTNFSLQKIEDTDYAGDFPTIYNDNLDLIDSAIASKQDKLVAGSNITISGSTISAKDTTYTAGSGIRISNNTINSTVSQESWTIYTGTLDSLFYKEGNYSSWDFGVNEPFIIEYIFSYYGQSPLSTTCMVMPTFYHVTNSYTDVGVVQTLSEVNNYNSNGVSHCYIRAQSFSDSFVRIAWDYDTQSSQCIQLTEMVIDWSATTPNYFYRLYTLQ